MRDLTRFRAPIQFDYEILGTHVATVLPEFAGLGSRNRPLTRIRRTQRVYSYAVYGGFSSDTRDSESSLCPEYPYTPTLQS